MATSVGVARPHGTVALFGAPPPFAFIWRQQHSWRGAKTRVQKTHRENEIAFLSAPAIAGAESACALVLATHPRPRFADQSYESSSPQKNEGRRSAGRRNCPVGPRHANRCCHLFALRAKPRVQRDALASRRSTAALTEVSRPRLFDSRPGFLGRGPGGRYPLFPVPVQRKHPAHRSSCRRT